MSGRAARTTKDARTVLDAREQWRPCKFHADAASAFSLANRALARVDAGAARVSLTGSRVKCARLSVAGEAAPWSFQSARAMLLFAGKDNAASDDSAPVGMNRPSGA